jgi:DNA-binding beta-propeller fold protein YncE
VAQPRIAAFARVANGTMAPARVISGAATKMSRTVHGIAYDPVRDEIYVSNALADAVLVFRGNASGAEPPVRMIQGPCTGLVNPHSVSLDLEHREILVSSLSAQAIAVFPMDANGNVTPIRYIKGPKTRLGHTVGLGVDSETNVLVVANAEDVLFFDRTATGDVAPLGEIRGEHTGIRDEPWELQIHKGKIFLAASNHLHVNLYSQVTLKPEYANGRGKVPEDPWLNPELGFIGVWNVRDRGDVPPRARIGGPFSQLVHPTGLALNPKDGEIYVTDGIRNALFSFLVPDLLGTNPRLQ